MGDEDKSKVDSILNESQPATWRELLATSRASVADAASDVSKWDNYLGALQSMHVSMVHGAQERGAAPYGGSLQPGPGQSVYGDPGSFYYDTTPQNHYNITPNSRGGARTSLVVDARSPITASEVKSRNSTDEFFSSKHGVVTADDTAFAQKFPSSATAQRVSSAAAPQPFVAPIIPPASLNAFSTTQADARRIAQQYGPGGGSTTFTPGRQSEPSYINGQTVYPALPAPLLSLDTPTARSTRSATPAQEALEWAKKFQSLALTREVE
jgi:hypothetical protein